MHDIIIIGGGSAGLSAAIYARRFLMKTLVIGKSIGGLLTTTHLVENWPGEKGISGYDLMLKIEEHARSLGAELINDEVKSIKKSSKFFKVSTDESSYEAKSLILATGTIHRKLGVPGEDKFYAKGVSYCATCDAPFFKGKIVGVVGGGDSAVKESLLLSEFAKKVYIIYRDDKLKAEPINAKRIEEKISKGLIEGISKTLVNGIKGDGKRFNGVILDNGKELMLDGLFIDVGLIPQNELAKSLGVKLNAKGEIIVDRASRTNIPGVFAAGDCADAPYKQAITGSAEGVIASFSAYDYINSKV